MNECEFCRIVAGDSPAHHLYVDEQTIAFLDSDPAIEGHALIAPKEHRKDLLTAAEPITGTVFQTVRTVAGAIERTLAPDGFSVFHTSGGLIGNVNHVHVHLVPRYTDDDIHLALSRQSLVDEDAARLAARIRDGL